MDEGVFRALVALAGRPAADERDWVRRSGEAESVLRDVRARYAKFFEPDAPPFRLSRAGEVAVGMESLARYAAAQGSSPDAALERFASMARGRPEARRELDQIHATTETSMRRARLLIERGDVQRGLCFLGDDDLVSLALLAAGVDRRVTVLDVDDALLDHITRGSADAPRQTFRHDLRQPLGRKLAGRFGCVFTDPPYALEGFRLFVSRAIDLLRPDGRLWVAFGHSRRAPERALAKQRALLEAGLVILDVLPDFNRYQGAESIGASSDLYLLGRTPGTKPLVSGVAEGELYTSRSPS